MAYLRAAFSRLYRLRINESDRSFTVQSALSTWGQPQEGTVYGNHKSATIFRNKATEMAFYGRTAHKHSVVLVRESDRNVLATIEVDEAGVASMQHANTDTSRMIENVGAFEHVALLVGFPNEQFTICIFDERHADTDLIRYRTADAKFYILAQYLAPQTRITMSARSRMDSQTNRGAGKVSSCGIQLQ